jgi:rubredoxin
MNYICKICGHINENPELEETKPLLITANTKYRYYYFFCPNCGFPNNVKK